jgi:two-component system, NarL family, invasion response regulator UvrY
VCHEKEYTYEQIADKMGVQHRTVDGYRESIFEKFAIKSKTGLVLFVLKHRLFDHLKVS